MLADTFPLIAARHEQPRWSRYWASGIQRFDRHPFRRVSCKLAANDIYYAN